MVPNLACPFSMFWKGHRHSEGIYHLLSSHILLPQSIFSAVHFHRVRGFQFLRFSLFHTFVAYQVLKKAVYLKNIIPTGLKLRNAESGRRVPSVHTEWNGPAVRVDRSDGCRSGC